MNATSENLLRHVRQLAAKQILDSLTDRQLLERFVEQRDETTFALLVRRHGSMVLSTCRRVLGHEQDAEDAFQATFLILARKAEAIRQSDVGGFLYRVAYHLAVRSRLQAHKRKQRDKRGETMPATDPRNDAAWLEVRAVVDEELQRLPDGLRAALVLCHLEGKTHDEAARLLGWSKGTLRRRLGQGRETLRTRLIARGMAPMAALTASLFSEGIAPAAVPTALYKATLRTVLAGKAAPTIAALAEGGLQMLAIGKTKLTAAILLAMSLLSGAGVWTMRELPAHTVSPVTEASDDKPQTTAIRKETIKTEEIHGQVLGPDGKPMAGVKLLRFGTDDKLESLGVSSEDGRFAVPLPKEKKGYLVAQAEGWGIDFVDLDSVKSRPVELRLVKDRTVNGRVVNTEGKPVRGVRVTVDHLGVYANNSMDSFLIAWKKRHFMSGIPGGVRDIWSEMGVLFTATTDAEGRFALHGLGEERLVSLRLRGAGIADEDRWIVTRNKFDPQPYNQATLDNIPKGQEQFSLRRFLSGPELSIVTETEKIVGGVVKDAESGKGRSGVRVQMTRRDGGALLHVIPSARTDAQGRYEIRGVHKANRYMLEVAGDPATGHVAGQVWVADTPGYQPIAADIAVKKGVIVTGRMLDKATGRPVRGYGMVAVLNNNPFVKEYPSLDSSAWFPMRDTGEDGRFRLVTIPGPVLLMGGPKDYRAGFKYNQPKPDPKYPQYFRNELDFTAYYGPGGSMTPLQGNFCKVLELKPDSGIVEQDIVLEPASVLSVGVQDADGKPLTGFWVTGHTGKNWFPATKCEAGTCLVYELQPGKPRLLVFYETKRELLGTLALNGEEKAPVVVKLGPGGSVKGRLLDADGKPLAGVTVYLNYRERPAEEIHHVIDTNRQIVTDADGEFSIDRLIPQHNFELGFRRGKRSFKREPKPADAKIQVKAGENRDLGGIRLKLVAEREEE